MRSACAWWWIIPCMKRHVRVGVACVGWIAASSSGVSFRDGWPGAPGWTMFGAGSPTTAGVVVAAAAAGERERDERRRQPRARVDHAHDPDISVAKPVGQPSPTEEGMKMMQPLAARRAVRARRSISTLLGALLVSATLLSSVGRRAPSTTDPRATLTPGFDERRRRRERHSSCSRTAPSRPASSTRRTRATSAFVNSDLALQGDHAFVGNFNGFLIYDIADPANPTLRTAVVCPGGQGEVSVYGNLLFMSAEETRARTDCGAPAVPDRQPAALPRRARLRHQRTSTRPVQVAAVQTCRGSHTHTLLKSPSDAGQHLRLRERDGRRPARRPSWRAARLRPRR